VTGSVEEPLAGGNVSDVVRVGETVPEQLRADRRRAEHVIRTSTHLADPTSPLAPVTGHRPAPHRPAPAL
jgi:hypothetical protein